MGKKITIDPVTRVEGHGKVTIHLDDNGQVNDAFFHIVEFRGFEKFIQGHPYWEAPVLVQRLCGICPVSHHLAAAKAIDQIVGVDPEDLPPAASKLRKILHYGQVLQSHALHFFYLASPDLLYGLDSDYRKRNVMQVAIDNQELAKRGILIRKFGQEVIKAVAGKKIHGITAVPGGVHKTLTNDERRSFFTGDDIPSIHTIIQWSLETIAFIKDYHAKNSEWLDNFAAFPSGHLGLVNKNGGMDLYHGRLRAIDADGTETLLIPDIEYADHFIEEVKKWSFLKFPYIKYLGRETGWNRVGPLARLNVCNHITTPLAEKERKEFLAYTDGVTNNMTMHTHWARLIEMLHCAEKVKYLLEDPEIMDSHLRTEGEKRNEGIGIIEAPRGTLIHHYLVDEKGMITKCNLIVSTTHNNEAMNRATKWVAQNVLNGSNEITEPMLNQVEVAIRAYDPCLSCATHAIGNMPLQVQLFSADGQLINEKVRHE